MVFREVSVVEIREVLRAWLDGAGLRTVGERAGVDRKTARRYVQAAEAAGLVRDAGADAITDEPVGAVVAAVRPVRPNGHGPAWEALAGHEEQIRAWVTGPGRGRPIGRCLWVKVHELLSRQADIGTRVCTIVGPISDDQLQRRRHTSPFEATPFGSSIFRNMDRETERPSLGVHFQSPMALPFEEGSSPRKASTTWEWDCTLPGFATLMFAEFL